MTQKSEFQGSLTHHIARGSTIVLFFAFLAAPIGYLTRMLYSRSLSIEMFGLFYSILAFLTIFTTFNDLGFGYSLSYLVPKFIKNKEKQKIWNTFRYDQIIEVSTAIILSIVLYFSSDFLASNYFKTDISSDLIKIFLIFFIAESFLSAIDKFFVGLQQEEYYSSIKIAKLGFGLMFSLIVFWLGKGNVIWYAVSWSLSHMLVAIIYKYILYRRNRTIISKLTWDKSLFVRMSKYAFPTLLVSSIGIISAPIDSILLIFFKDLSAVGVYNIILPLVVITPIFLTPINNLLFPLISKIEDEPKKVTLLMESMLKIVPYLATYFAIFIFLFPESIVQTVFGSKWVELAATPLKIASLGYIFLPMSSLMGTFANGLGLVKEKSKLSIIITVLKVLLNLFFIYSFGIVGAIFTNIVMFTMGTVFLAFHIRKRFLFSVPIFFYGKLILFGLLIYSVSHLFGLNPRGIMEIGLTGFLYTLLYLIFGIIFEVVDKKSIMILFNNKKNIRWIR